MKHYIKLMLVLAVASAGMNLQAITGKIEDYTWSDADCAKNKNINSPNTVNAFGDKLVRIATEYTKAQGADKEFWVDMAALLITNIKECYNTEKAPRAANTVVLSLLSQAQGKGRNKVVLFSNKPSEEELDLRAALALGQDALNTGSTADGFNSLAKAITLFNQIYGKKDALYDRAITLTQKLLNKTKGIPVVQETPEEKALEIALDKALTALVKVSYLNADDSLNTTPNFKAEDESILTPVQTELVKATTALKIALENKGLNPFDNGRYLLADTIGNRMIDAIQKIQSLPGRGGQKPPTPPPSTGGGTTPPPVTPPVTPPIDVKKPLEDAIKKYAGLIKKDTCEPKDLEAAINDIKGKLTPYIASLDANEAKKDALKIEAEKLLLSLDERKELCEVVNDLVTGIANMRTFTKNPDNGGSEIKSRVEQDWKAYLILTSNKPNENTIKNLVGAYTPFVKAKKLFDLQQVVVATKKSFEDIKKDNAGKTLPTELISLTEQKTAITDAIDKFNNTKDNIEAVSGDQKEDAYKQAMQLLKDIDAAEKNIPTEQKADPAKDKALSELEKQAASSQKIFDDLSADLQLGKLPQTSKETINQTIKALEAKSTAFKNAGGSPPDANIKNLISKLQALLDNDENFEPLPSKAPAKPTIEEFVEAFKNAETNIYDLVDDIANPTHKANALKTFNALLAKMRDAENYLTTDAKLSGHFDHAKGLLGVLVSALGLNKPKDTDIFNWVDKNANQIQNSLK